MTTPAATTTMTTTVAPATVAPASPCATVAPATVAPDSPCATAAPVAAVPCATVAPVMILTPAPVPLSPCGTAPPPMESQIVNRLFDSRDAKHSQASAFSLGNAGLIAMGFACISALAVGVRAMKQRRTASVSRTFAPLALEEGATVRPEVECDQQETPLIG